MISILDYVQGRFERAMDELEQERAALAHERQALEAEAAALALELEAMEAELTAARDAMGAALVAHVATPRDRVLREAYQAARYRYNTQFARVYIATNKKG